MSKYEVNDQGFESFIAAVAAANPLRANVIESATRMIRWRPAKAAPSKRSHVIVNIDGTQQEFSKIRR